MKTSEMIAMLEGNPKLRFRRKSWRVLKKQAGVDIDDSIGLWHPDGKHSGITLYIKQDDWEIIQQPVTFAEAMKAFAEGKNVRAEGCPGNPCDSECCKGERLYRAGTRLIICHNEMAHAKWFIEEGKHERG